MWVRSLAGGVTVAAILSVGAVFLRRRQQQKRHAKRGMIPLGDSYHWPGKPSVKSAGLGEQN